ncbi:nuclear transport factor 2 family protein, partial [Bacillus cereus]|uniref:nuclear transport factor 2 family protein n=1 Tax=Bacillus cereus TaxID=1396 RepID=UPI0036348180
MANATELYFKLVEAIQAGDDAATRAMFSPDFVLYQDGGMPYGGTYRGVDEFMELWGRVVATWGGTHFEPLYQIADPNGTRICAVVYFKAKPGSSKVTETVDTTLAEIWEFKDGQAVEARIW